jgi:UDP-N-acetylmuramoylalanine--D-glutamate ligase
MTTVVVGLGKTGASCVRYLARRGLPVSVTDSRPAPPGLAELAGLKDRVNLRLGSFDLGLLDGASQVVMSPGVSPEEPIAATARSRGIEVVGDVELFARDLKARAAPAPVIGITGTNGKSTVTTLVAHMAAAAGRRVLAGGNLGEPALDLLAQPVPDLYVLELSSFQLDSSTSLVLSAAVVLNVSADHLDRYASVAAYAHAKSRIFMHAATRVINLDDPWVVAMRASPDARRGAGGAGAPGADEITFSIQRSDADFSLLRSGAQISLARHGEALLDLTRMKIGGLHNAANALAALALGEAARLPLAPRVAALTTFAGLPHRSAWVAEIDGVRYIDDSKGTNVGATLAAVSGMPGPLVIIAGGQGKGQDFAPLAAAFRDKVRRVILIGTDAPAIAAALAQVCPTDPAHSMEDAVRAAQRAARPGDTVLLSPACASLDMFRDYAHRGDAFAAAVHALPGVRT